MFLFMRIKLSLGLYNRDNKVLCSCICSSRTHCVLLKFCCFTCYPASAFKSIMCTNFYIFIFLTSTRSQCNTILYFIRSSARTYMEKRRKHLNQNNPNQNIYTSFEHIIRKSTINSCLSFNLTN